MRTVVAPHSEIVGTDKHSGHSIPVTAGAAHPSLASPEHQFEWHGPGPQFPHMQLNQNWLTDANAQYYQPNNQQPFFTTPNYDRPQTLWPRHDSFYPTESNIQNDSKPQGFHNAHNKDMSVSSGVTMVPKTANDVFPTQSELARSGHVGQT